jgi:hypothetical protein
MHTALPTPIAASLAVDANMRINITTILALLTPSRQGALEVVAVTIQSAVIRII